MKVNNNYPPMSTIQMENAPWNDIDVPEEEFSIICSQSLSKKVTVTTNDYVLEEEEDEEGSYPVYETTDTNWDNAYKENNHYTPIELLEMFGKLLEGKLKEGEILLSNPRYTKHIIQECYGWSEDECEFIEE